jgi:hypothetical protein
LKKKDINALFVKGNLILAQTNHGFCRSTDNGNNWTTDKRNYEHYQNLLSAVAIYLQKVEINCSAPPMMA